MESVEIAKATRTAMNQTANTCARSRQFQIKL
jgi:hypothetical protein